MTEVQDTVEERYQPISVILEGHNESLQGYLNVTVKHRKHTYDEEGAAVYVIAVILVYGLSMVLLIGSLAKKNMKDKSQDIEEGQVSQYLNDVPNLKERSQRDKYKELKSNIVQIVNSRAPLGVSRNCNSSGSSERHAQTLNNETSDGTHVDNKLSDRSGNENIKPNTGNTSESSPLLPTPSDLSETSSKDKHQYRTTSLPTNTAAEDDASPVLRHSSKTPWGITRIYDTMNSDSLGRSGCSGYHTQHSLTFDDPVQEWLYSPYNFSYSNKRDEFQSKETSQQDSLNSSSERLQWSRSPNTSQIDLPTSAFSQSCTCPHGSYNNVSYVPTSPQLKGNLEQRTARTFTPLGQSAADLLIHNKTFTMPNTPSAKAGVHTSYSNASHSTANNPSAIRNGGPHSKSRLPAGKRKSFQGGCSSTDTNKPFVLRSLEQDNGESYGPYSRSNVCYNHYYVPAVLDETSGDEKTVRHYINSDDSRNHVTNV